MDPRVTEFQCIMPMVNIPSVLEHGILSFEAAEEIEHKSIALEEAQEKRDAKRVPGGLLLHQYANLYFHARNPMMSKRRHEASNLCILRVSLEVRNIKGSVLADRNAAGGDRWVRFLHPDQWRLLDFDRIMAVDWRDDDRFTYYDKKRKKCAEILVPGKVPPSFVGGAYVVSDAAAGRLKALGFALPITVDPDMFFH
ncbi:DUF4433 domain-containing protein [bacterium]|nr:DUF4433 domain-containing protein [bacterium]